MRARRTGASQTSSAIALPATSTTASTRRQPPAPRARASAPRQSLEQQHVDRDPDRDDAAVVGEVAQIQDAARDALESRPGAEQPAELTAHVAEGVGDAARERGADERHDLVVGRGRHAHPDRQVRRGQQQRAEIAADHRAEVEVAHLRDRDRQPEREPERDRDQQHAGDELADHELPARHRQRQQDLERARATLLGPQPHRERRDQDDQQPRHPLEQRPQVGEAAREELLAPEERVERDGEERGEEDHRDRRVEVAAQLLLDDRPHHAAAS